MGLVSFVVGYQKVAWESLELHTLTPLLSSLLRRKLEPSTAKANQELLFEGEITPLKPNPKPC